MKVIKWVTRVEVLKVENDFLVAFNAAENAERANIPINLFYWRLQSRYEAKSWWKRKTFMYLFTINASLELIISVSLFLRLFLLLLLLLSLSLSFFPLLFLFLNFFFEVYATPTKNRT